MWTAVLRNRFTLFCYVRDTTCTFCEARSLDDAKLAENLIGVDMDGLLTISLCS